MFVVVAAPDVAATTSPAVFKGVGGRCRQRYRCVSPGVHGGAEQPVVGVVAVLRRPRPCSVVGAAATSCRCGCRRCRGGRRCSRGPRSPTRCRVVVWVSSWLRSVHVLVVVTPLPRVVGGTRDSSSYVYPTDDNTVVPRRLHGRRHPRQPVIAIRGHRTGHVGRGVQQPVVEVRRRRRRAIRVGTRHHMTVGVVAHRHRGGPITERVDPPGAGLTRRHVRVGRGHGGTTGCHGGHASAAVRWWRRRCRSPPCRTGSFACATRPSA